MFRKWFAQAGRIATLERENEFLTRQCEFAEDRAIRAEQKVELLEKAVKSERDKRDRFAMTAFDKVTKNTGAFQKSLLEPEKPKPVEPDPIEESRIEAAAKLQMQADIDSGFDPWPLEEYAKRIADDPKRYLPQ